MKASRIVAGRRRAAGRPDDVTPGVDPFASSQELIRPDRRDWRSHQCVLATREPSNPRRQVRDADPRPRRPRFQVSSITTGRVLYTVGFGPRFGRDINGSGTPSHGISPTPNERQLWVMDPPHRYVQIFDVSAVPRRPPREIANVKLIHANDDGWIQMNRNGCFVYIGDSGDVLSTRTLKPIAYLPALANTKESIEIDWRHGLPVATSTRTGIGYVTRGSDPRPPACH